MQTKSIHTSKINGAINAPYSKSILQRILLAEFLSGNDLPIYKNACDDVLNTYNSLENFKLKKSEIYLGESGFCLRVLPVLASSLISFNKFQLSEGLSKRPIIELLRSLGLDCEISKNALSYSLTVKGSIIPGEYKIDCSITSQILTGLLFTLPILESDSSILVDNLASKPYIDLTIDILKSYSINIINNNYKEFIIPGSQEFIKISDYELGDWSGASFLISAATLVANSSVRIFGLNKNSCQADIDILKILDKSGANYNIDDDCLTVYKSSIKSFCHDFTDCPDLLPAIIPLAISADKKCHLMNITKLKYKESNRVNAIIDEYKKIGITILNQGDDMIVFPGKVEFAEVDSTRDHRIAMSLGVSGLISNSYIKVHDCDSISKSYPSFWNDLLYLGADIR